MQCIVYKDYQFENKKTIKYELPIRGFFLVLICEYVIINMFCKLCKGEFSHELVSHWIRDYVLIILSLGNHTQGVLNSWKQVQSS